MTDAERLADLARRVAALEGAPGGRSDPDAGPDRPPGAFWALAALQRHHPEGAVLFTGALGMPDGRRYEWQETRPAEALLGGDWTDAGAALAALASPVRLRLVREVLRGERTSAAELAELEGLGTSGQVYHHLRQLTAAGWLRAAARGRYEVPPERVVPLLVVVAAAR